ncbi:MAG: carboxylating nicotinate-nucleotide diphosphorylase [Flavobacteriales bacterium]|nr:carboxylating nicotinate-nucleotide diphosphorylase [Flavobacteriales bacterium]MCX7767991.1 carboxylating nicotinate-nucleotide diphosphorylase [Flavobacteriales bacterium]MDW8409196.1 carboxylating nicotinate-nucleotide diphosphorylase [Flavobacteriales bacterium]
MTLEEFLKKSLEEDIGSGDHTSLATVSSRKKAAAQLLYKENGVVAGLAVVQKLCSLYDPALQVKFKVNEGEEVDSGTVAMDLSGPARSILAVERTLLNIVQRMSGIATKTRRMVKTIAPTGCQLLDTRKTTPLNRMIEKEAVRIGGALNHRRGLFDMILIKDNHIKACGGITKAIRKTQAYLKRNGLALPIEIEVRNLQELDEVLSVGGVQRILLDNFSPAQLEKAVKCVNSRFETEASGGIDEDNVLEYALTGVMYISSGALTHSVKSLDVSLKIR